MRPARGQWKATATASRTVPRSSLPGDLWAAVQAAYDNERTTAKLRDAGLDDRQVSAALAPEPLAQVALDPEADQTRNRTVFAIVGRPTGVSSAHVLDARPAPVAPGGVGELYLGGPQVSDGYAAHPAQTAERFVDRRTAERISAAVSRTLTVMLTHVDDTVNPPTLGAQLR